MASYARNDTRYLKPLADIVRTELEAKGRRAWHEEMCARLIADCAEIRPADPDVVWRVKGSHQLAPAALGVLREIWHWREKEAIRTNKPPYFVLAPEAMVQIAMAGAEAQSVKEVLPRHLSPHRREGILKAIAAGLALEQPPGVLRRTSYRQTETEKRRMHELEKRRNRHAAELGLDPTLIASRAMLVLLAKDWEAHEGELMQWQRKLLKA